MMEADHCYLCWCVFILNSLNYKLDDYCNSISFSALLAVWRQNYSTLGFSRGKISRLFHLSCWDRVQLLQANWTVVGAVGAKAGRFVVGGKK